MPPVGVPFLTHVLAKSNIGLRSERELRTLFEIIDRQAQGNVAGSADVAMQRAKAVIHVSRREAKGQASAWQVARHSELIPTTTQPDLLSRAERRAAAREENAERRLGKAAPR